MTDVQRCGDNRPAALGVVSLDGAFIGTALGAEGEVLWMRVFPAGGRGISEFARFAGQRSADGSRGFVGLAADDGGLATGARALEASLRPMGFRVVRVQRRCGAVPGSPQPGIVGGPSRGSLLAAQAALRLGLRGRVVETLEEHRHVILAAGDGLEGLLRRLVNVHFPGLAELAGDGRWDLTLLTFLRRYPTPDRFRLAGSEDLARMARLFRSFGKDVRFHRLVGAGSVGCDDRHSRMMIQWLADDMLHLRLRRRCLESAVRRYADEETDARPEITAARAIAVHAGDDR